MLILPQTENIPIGKNGTLHLSDIYNKKYKSKFGWRRY